MKIIVNADDFGINTTVNQAIVECFQKRYISNTTIMPNMGCSEEAVKLAQEKQFFDQVGLHLNLMEGKPLTERIRQEPFFCDENGLFRLDIPPLVKYFTTVKMGEKAVRIALEEEITAQIQWYLDHGFTEKHMDSHQSTHAWLFILSAVLPIFQKYGMKTMRPRYSDFHQDAIRHLYCKFINRRIPHSVNAFYDGKAFIEHCGLLNQDGVYEVMCHPDYLNGELVDNVSGIPIEMIAGAENVALFSYRDYH